MRPAYLCRVCAAPWPCSAAQLDLVTEFHGRPVDLAIYLAAAMHDAIHDTLDLGFEPDLAALHARFLGWICLVRRPRRRIDVLDERDTAQA